MLTKPHMFNSAEFSQSLAQKITVSGLIVSHDIQQQLLQFLQLLAKWNQTYNLTSVCDPEKMITQHVLDSLAILPYIQGKRILDVGSGAGLPGIPLALVLPQMQFVLLDSNGKKTRFLTHVVQSLKIPNIQVMQTRVEELKNVECFDIVMARAFSSLHDFLQKTQHLCCNDGKFLAMKGAHPTDEIKEIPAGFKLEAVHPLKVPGLDAQRCLVCVTKEQVGDIITPTRS